MSKEWYRRRVWSSEDAKDFENKLMRAHSRNRAQYLRIQAHHLAEASLHAPALQLLDRMLMEYPGNLFIALAHHQRADLLLRLGKPEEAIVAYRQAMEAQRKNPNIRTGSYLDFAWFVAQTSRTSLLDEAIEVLKEFGGEEAWPIAKFKHFGALAIIYAAKGNFPLASRHAKKALAAMDAKESGFRYHRNLGLVRDVDHHMIKRLNDLAAS
jgi:tetratricopeptide (TPR) repeat protein